MEIGFTGTRDGMTEEQRKTVKNLLFNYQPTKGHHGDCIGADKDFHSICRELGIRVKGHPPKKDDCRAFCEFDETEIPKDYHTRDRAIVNQSELLIATPKETSEQPKGGTWYTAGYAKYTVKNPLIIVWPDGSTETFNCGT